MWQSRKTEHTHTHRACVYVTVFLKIASSSNVPMRWVCLLFLIVLFSGNFFHSLLLLKLLLLLLLSSTSSMLSLLAVRAHFIDFLFHLFYFFLYIVYSFQITNNLNGENECWPVKWGEGERESESLEVRW